MPTAQTQYPRRAQGRYGLGTVVTAVVAAALLSAFAAYSLGYRHAQPSNDTAAARTTAKEQWQCPMHPTIIQDHPGNCPICGMKLVKVEDSGAGQMAERAEAAPSPEGLAGVTIDPARQQLIGLTLANVERAKVSSSWRTPGRIAVDETRVHHVNVKFSGFMESVYGGFVGRYVQEGEPLFSIYSPELLSAQEELLVALRTRKKLSGGAMASDGAALVAAARKKLELWDMPESEIARVERTEESSRTITFYAPASGVLTRKEAFEGMRVSAGDMPFEIVDLSLVWVLADAYESDLAMVSVGMPATLTLKAFPNGTFSGAVTFIDPILDPTTRTAKVRLEFPNEGGELKPEMFGEVVLQGPSHEGLRLPVDAVIKSGTQDVVFLSRGEGKFEPREVELGTGDSQYVEVVSGLDEGDSVVTRANFLIDSESRLRASLAALSDRAPDPHAGHRR